MQHIAELLGITSAEVYGTATFYEMFKFEPVGRYCVNICTRISCQLTGAWELLEHAEQLLGVKTGGTTRRRAVHARGRRVHRSLHGGARRSQVNHRYRYQVAPAELDQLIDDLRAGRLQRRDPAARDAGPCAPARPRRQLGAEHRTREKPHGEGRTHDERGHALSTCPGLVADRPEAGHGPLRPGGRLHLRRLRPHRWLHGAAQGADHDDAAAGARRGQDDARCRAAVAPASRRAPSGASSRPACSRGTSSSTATRASPAPTRTAC